MTTTTTPTISRRLEDGTWRTWDFTIRTPWEFSAEDAADAETLTAWLREFLRDEGEGVWAADYGDIESEVVTIGPTTDDIYRIACDTVDGDRIIDAELVPDDCGSLTLVAIKFSDGTDMIVGPEDDGGYTFSVYAKPDYDEQPMMERFLTTDGDTTVDTLADTIRHNSRPANL